MDDSCNISSIIDWQGIWVGPLMLEARHPKLVDYDGEIILKHPNNFDELEPDKRNEMEKQIASSIIIYLYEKEIAVQNPRLHKVFHLKSGRRRTEPILFAGDTWDNDILPLRETLIRIARWVEPENLHRYP
jgi:hypothetical protein